MRKLITSPEEFALRFNQKVPGAYRRMSTSDVRLMAECGLIHRYGCYLNDDFETVRRLLRYEELREKRTQKQEQEATIEPPRCKDCGEPLPIQPEGKAGRPKEYCSQCEPARGRFRYRKWRKKRRSVMMPTY